LDLEFIIAVVLDTVVHGGVHVASTLAGGIVVGVITVAILSDHLAVVFLLFHLGLSVCVNIIHHVDNILAAVGAAGARARRAESKANKVLGIEE
jgi:hypothetical protein